MLGWSALPWPLFTLRKLVFPILLHKLTNGLISFENQPVNFDPLFSFWKVSITSMAKMPVKPAGKALLNFLTDRGKESVCVPDFLYRV